MNIAFVLTPKADVVWIPERATIRQALERMDHHRYSAVPVLDEEGRYVGTLTEGDLLWKIRSLPDFHWPSAERIPLSEVPRRFEVRAAPVHAEIEELLARAVDQNFVPVVDSRGVFMGLVTRKSLIEYCTRHLPGR